MRKTKRKNYTQTQREREWEKKKSLTSWIANQVVWHIVQKVQTDYGSCQNRIVLHRPSKISYSLSCYRWKSRPIDEPLISMLYWRYWSKVQFRGCANSSPLADFFDSTIYIYAYNECARFKLVCERYERSSLWACANVHPIHIQFWFNETKTKTEKTHVNVL